VAHGPPRFVDTGPRVGLRYRPGLGVVGALIHRIHLRSSVQAAMERSAANLAAIAERELSGAATT
jgi:hypothetical protein